MKIVAIVLIALSLAGCAGLGTFVGSTAGAYDNSTRPQVVYERPYERPYYRPWHRRGW